MLLIELWAFFLNGLTPLETTQDIIDKDEETKKVVKEVKINVENVIIRVWSGVPSLEVTTKVQVGGSKMSHQ